MIFESQRPEFHPKSAHVRFMVDKVALGEVFLGVLRFRSVSIIPPMLRARARTHTHTHTHLHLHVALTRRTNGRSVRTFQKTMLCRKLRSTGYKITFRSCGVSRNTHNLVQRLVSAFCPHCACVSYDSHKDYQLLP